MFAFPRAKRLLTQAAYRHVFSAGKRKVRNGFVAIYRNNTLTTPRLGLAISKKQVAKATHRNQLKRLIRESFRQTALPNLDVVILVRKQVNEASQPELQESLKQLWHSLNASPSV